MHNPPLQHFIETVVAEIACDAPRRVQPGTVDHARLQDAHAIAQKIDAALGVSARTMIGIRITSVVSLAETIARIEGAGLHIEHIEDVPISPGGTQHHIHLTGQSLTVTATTFAKEPA